MSLQEVVERLIQASEDEDDGEEGKSKSGQLGDVLIVYTKGVCILTMK